MHLSTLIWAFPDGIFTTPTADMMARPAQASIVTRDSQWLSRRVYASNGIVVYEKANPVREFSTLYLPGLD